MKVKRIDIGTMTLTYEKLFEESREKANNDLFKFGNRKGRPRKRKTEDDETDEVWS